jgi:hypothetical protein
MAAGFNEIPDLLTPAFVVNSFCPGRDDEEAKVSDHSWTQHGRAATQFNVLSLLLQVAS